MQNKGIEKLSKEEMIHIYNADVQRLQKYVPWLESKKGINLVKYYSSDPIEKASISIPTYDPTLLSFVKDVKTTSLIDKNYQYIYSKYNLKTAEDELRMIENTRISDLSILKGILSRYVLIGMIKSTMWNEGVENQVFLKLLIKLKALMETWDQPLA